MLRVSYNPQIIRKAREITMWADTLPPKERDDYVRSLCRLSYEYVKRIGSYFKEPSDRVLMNLGYEVYVKDIATGEMSRLELNVPCDWNPKNPRMNPVSGPVFVTAPSELSSTSE